MKRWSSNTWILAILGAIIILTGLDMGRRLLAGTPPEPPPDPNALRTEMAPGFKEGEKAPDFTLPDAAGKKRRLAELVKGDTLLTFSCGCSNCRDVQAYLGKLRAQMGGKFPAVVTVATSPPEAEKSWIRDTELPQTMLFDNVQTKDVGNLYKGHPCPRVFRLDADRTVTWIGPSPRELPSPMNMEPMGYLVANQLGFEAPGDKPGNKPKAPRMVTSGMASLALPQTAIPANGPNASTPMAPSAQTAPPPPAH
jgi:peroxiredoxin